MSMISEEPTLLTFLYLKNGNTDWAVNAGVRRDAGVHTAQLSPLRTPTLWIYQKDGP